MERLDAISGGERRGQSASSQGLENARRDGSFQGHRRAYHRRSFQGKQELAVLILECLNMAFVGVQV